MQFALWEWSLFAVAALVIGMSKAGIPGLGILNVAIFQILLMGKDATGFGLPLLVLGDLCSVAIYRRHADWTRVLRLLPWAAVGVVAGYFALGVMSDVVSARIIGLTLLAMLVLHVWRERRPGLFGESLPKSWGVAATIGAIAGFVSTLANAAGPVMILYLLAMRLPKLAFMGTSVYFFTLLNLFKVPFLADLGLIHWGSFAANLKLAPFVLAGSALGYLYARRVSQAWFERVAFWLTALMVAAMLWNSFR